MIHLLRQRRSIRKFASNPIEKEKLEILAEAVLRSPSSKNSNPWEFIFFDDPDLLASLSQSKPHGAAFLRNAPLAVVVLADETKGDVWVEDCSIASIILQLTAQSLGLGSCWVQIRERFYSETLSSEQYIQQLLKLPNTLKVLSMIAIGYPDQTRDGKPFEELQQQKIHHNGFPSVE